MFGFLDQGRSFDKGFKILEDEFMLTSILSKETITFISHEREALMILWDINLAYDIAVPYAKERWNNLKTHVDVHNFLWHYI